MNVAVIEFHFLRRSATTSSGDELSERAALSAEYAARFSLRLARHAHTHPLRVSQPSIVTTTRPRWRHFPTETPAPEQRQP